MRSGRRRRLASTGLLAAVAALSWSGPLAAPAYAEDRELPTPPQFSAQSAEHSAAVVAAEDRRLTEIRTVTSLARWQGKNWKTPYRLSSTSGYTLVLTPSSTEYTVEDLLELAPQTFVRMSDGSYLLSEHIAVTPRATLRLSSPGGLTLRLASSSEGFSTIVSLGGELEIEGEEDAPAVITSWDPTTGVPDATLEDGRGYLRAIGGQFTATYVEARDLGFWSGRTGGIALTGTDRPNTGAIESTAERAADGTEESLLGDVDWQPAGPLEADDTGPDLRYAVPALDYVSTQVSHLTAERNAYGLFVSGANGVQVTDSVFRDNSLGGVVLHRYVRNGVLTRTTSERNAGDGFTLGRATTGITIVECTARDNAGSGFSISGRPLADGPSAVGSSLKSYGNNSVSHSTATHNGGYGIEVLGGFNIGVHNSTVSDHDMGIMVDGPSQRISVTGNEVSGAERHGIALVDGVDASTVTGNVVTDAATGVYLRDSSGAVSGNTVKEARSHGISFVGEVEASEASFNVLAGSGPSALDLIRSDGDIAVETNNTDGWLDTTPWYYWFKKLLQPMTALWSVLIILIVTSALRARGDHGRIEHPYAHQMAHQGHLPVPAPRVVDLRDDERVGVQ